MTVAAVAAVAVAVVAAAAVARFVTVRCCRCCLFSFCCCCCGPLLRFTAANVTAATPAVAAASAATFPALCGLDATAAPEGSLAAHYLPESLTTLRANRCTRPCKTTCEIERGPV